MIESLVELKNMDTKSKNNLKKAIERMHVVVNKDEGKHTIQWVADQLTAMTPSLGVTAKELADAYKSIFDIKEDVPTNSVAGGGVSLPPDARYSGIDVTDKRRRKDKQPRILKRFQSHSGY